MAIVMTKSKLTLILVSVLTVVVAVFAIFTAVLLQQNNVGPKASKAATTTATNTTTNSTLNVTPLGFSENCSNKTAQVYYYGTSDGNLTVLNCQTTATDVTDSYMYYHCDSTTGDPGHLGQCSYNGKLVAGNKHTVPANGGTYTTSINAPNAGTCGSAQSDVSFVNFDPTKPYGTNGKFVAASVSCGSTSAGPLPTATPPAAPTGKCSGVTVPNKAGGDRQIPVVNIYAKGDVGTNNEFLHAYRPDNGYDYATGISPTWNGTKPAQYFVHYALYTSNGLGQVLTPTWASYVVAMNFTTNPNTPNGNSFNMNFNPTIPMLNNSAYDPNLYGVGYIITDSNATPTVTPPQFVGDTSKDPCYAYAYVQRPICGGMDISYKKDSIDGIHHAGDKILPGSTVIVGDDLNVGPITWNDNSGFLTTLHPIYNWDYSITNSSGSTSGIIDFNHTNSPTIESLIPSGITKAYYTISTYDIAGHPYVLRDPIVRNAWDNPKCYTQVNVVASANITPSPQPTRIPDLTPSPTLFPTPTIIILPSQTITQTSIVVTTTATTTRTIQDTSTPTPIPSSIVVSSVSPTVNTPLPSTTPKVLPNTGIGDNLILPILIGLSFVGFAIFLSTRKKGI